MNSVTSLNRIFTDLIDREAVLTLLKGAVACESVTGNEANFVDFLETHLSVSEQMIVRGLIILGAVAVSLRDVSR